jgi:hypothetical protein
VPSMFCSGSVDCRGSRICRRIDGVRRYSSSLAQEREVAAAIDAGEEGGLAFDQLHMMRRRSRELGPVELLLQGVKDIVVDGARVS